MWLASDPQKCQSHLSGLFQTGNSANARRQRLAVRFIVCSGQQRPVRPDSGDAGGRVRARPAGREQARKDLSDPLDPEWVEDDHVSAVTRLVTFVDLAEGVGDTRQMAVSARHEAVLLDGRRVLLLDDRGWTEEAFTAFHVSDASDRDSRREQQPDIWAVTSVEDIEQTARIVVGPDEPFDGSSQEDAEEGHWAYLSAVLRQHGVVVDARDLSRLPHDVVLSERLLARVRRSATGV
jgi:hypothetical protein